MSNIPPTQIHAHCLDGVLRFRHQGLRPANANRLHANLDEGGTVLAFDQRGCFGMRACEPAPLVGANIQLKAFASLNGGQRHRPVPLPEGEDAGIVGNKARLERLDGTVFLLGKLAGTG